jgi:hypothetical protein
MSAQVLLNLKPTLADQARIASGRHYLKLNICKWLPNLSKVCDSVLNKGQWLLISSVTSLYGIQTRNINHQCIKNGSIIALIVT